MPTKPNLALYHYWRSSCSWRVRWGLAIKGLSYSSHPVNILAGEHTSADHLQRNPAGQLPALAVDGHFFSESLSILEWLEESYPAPPLLPKDALDRMYVRQLALTIACGTQPLQNPSILRYFVANEAERPQHARHFIEKGLATYEKILIQSGKYGTYSFGNAVTIADLCLVPQVYNALRFQVDTTCFPLIKKIYEACLLLPECEEAAPHRQPGAT